MPLLALVWSDVVNERPQAVGEREVESHRRISNLRGLMCPCCASREGDRVGRARQRRATRGETLEARVSWGVKCRSGDNGSDI
jgi:hypothetical protein